MDHQERIRKHKKRVSGTLPRKEILQEQVNLHREQIMRSPQFLKCLHRASCPKRLNVNSQNRSPNVSMKMFKNKSKSERTNQCKSREQITSVSRSGLNLTSRTIATAIALILISKTRIAKLTSLHCPKARSPCKSNQSRCLTKYCSSSRISSESSPRRLSFMLMNQMVAMIHSILVQNLMTKARKRQV